MKHKYYELFAEIFQMILVAYLILLVVESYKAGAVSDFFNMNYLLVVVLGSGIGMAITQNPTSHELRGAGKINPWTEDNIFLMLFLSVLGGVLVYVKTASLGATAYVVSGFTVVIIFLLSVLILSEDGNI